MAIQHAIRTCPYCRQSVNDQQIEFIRQAENDFAARLLTKGSEEAQQRIEELESKLETAREDSEARFKTELEKALAAKEQQLADQLERQVRAGVSGINKRLIEREAQLTLAQKTIETLERRLVEKAPRTRGGVQEADLVQRLRSEFPLDRITQVSLTGRTGADIEQEVFEDGESCGVILFESKDTQNWQASWVDKLLSDRTARGAAFAVLVSTACPPKSEGFDVVKGVPVIVPDFLVGLVSIIRQSLIDVHEHAVSHQDRGVKLERLAGYLGSPDFKNKMNGLFKALDDLRTLQSKEEAAHRRLWEQEALLIRAARSSSADVQSEIVAILAGR